MVGYILWSTTSTLLDGVQIDEDIQNAKILLLEEEKVLCDSILTNDEVALNSYKRLVEHYNRLVDLLDGLIHQTPYPVVCLETSKSLPARDPVVQVTTNACIALNTELDRIEQLLYRARTTHRLVIRTRKP